MEEINECPECLRKQMEFFDFVVNDEKKKLWHCKDCGISFWFKDDNYKKVEGLAFLCKTRRFNPENCDEFVLKVFGSPYDNLSTEPSGEIKILQTGIANMRKAGDICAGCQHKNFNESP